MLSTDHWSWLSSNWAFPGIKARSGDGLLGKGIRAGNEPSWRLKFHIDGEGPY